MIKRILIVLKFIANMLSYSYYFIVFGPIIVISIIPIGLISLVEYIIFGSKKISLLHEDLLDRWADKLDQTSDNNIKDFEESQ